MDRTDFALVAALVRVPLAPVSELGKQIGLSRNATQARLDRLRREGLLAEFMARPNAALFEKTPVLGLFPMAARAVPDETAIFEIPETWWYSINHEDVYAVGWLTDRHDPTEPPPGLETVMGVPAERRFVQRPPPLAPGTHLASPIEWRVIEAMLDEPRERLGILADKAGLAPRTFKKHRDALVADGRLEVQPLLFNASIAEGVVFEFWLMGAARRDLAEIQRYLANTIIVEEVAEPAGLLVLCQADNLAAALRAQGQIGAIESVQHVEMILSAGFAYARDKVRRWCREKRAAWDTARRRPAGAVL